MERTLSLDDNVIKEYFPVDVVVPTILEIYQDLLGVRFREVKDGSLWHPGQSISSVFPESTVSHSAWTEVQHFEVWEADSKTDADFLGYVYLDLYPREAKYSHAAVWPLVLGYEKEDGSRNYPVTGMVANLAKPTADRPALMRYALLSSQFRLHTLTMTAVIRMWSPSSMRWGMCSTAYCLGPNSQDSMEQSRCLRSQNPDRS